MWTLFNYLYRDAGNYKARGKLALTGQIDDDDIKRVEVALESGEFFIAEQVGVPPLQHLLQDQFGGRSEDDHCWHSLESWEIVKERPLDVEIHDDISNFVSRFSEIKAWREEMSPEFFGF